MTAGSKLTNTTNTHILPCKTFVSIGDCPFRNRCMYIHDMRIQCPQALKTSRAKSRKVEAETDLFYWPSMEGDSNSYVVPSDDPAMFSLWSHFVDFCQDCKQHHHPDSHQKQNHRHYRQYLHQLKASTSVAAAESRRSDVELNQYTHQKRLPVFFKLAQTPSSPSSSLPPHHPHPHHLPHHDEHERNKENRQAFYKSQPQQHHQQQQIAGICRSASSYYLPAPVATPPPGLACASAPASAATATATVTHRPLNNIFESPKSVDKTPHFESPHWTPLPSSAHC